jgi:hypothetical protein
MQHQTQTFILVANQNDWNLKASWAIQICESYQNSQVLLVLISANQTISREPPHPRCQLAYYPSNRLIEPHILLIQHLKTCQSERLNLVVGEPDWAATPLPKPVNAYLSCWQSNERIAIWSVDCQLFLSRLQNNACLVNELRSLMANSQTGE